MSHTRTHRHTQTQTHTQTHTDTDTHNAQILTKIDQIEKPVVYPNIRISGRDLWSLPTLPFCGKEASK